MKNLAISNAVPSDTDMDSAQQKTSCFAAYTCERKKKREVALQTWMGRLPQSDTFLMQPYDKMY
jgi:hypothetical protein